MYRINKLIILFLGFGIWHAWGANAAAQEDLEVAIGLKELAGELRKSHRYLFEASEWGKLDQLCDQLSGPKRRRRRRLPSPAERQAAEKRSAEAAEKLLPMLEKCPHVIRLTLADDKIVEPIKSPIRVPGDIGALLFRIQAGKGEIQYNTINYDMSKSNGPVEGRGSGAISMNIASPGVTWALVSITHVPVGPSTLLVKFQYPPDKSVAFLVDILAPSRGRTRISIMSADTGEYVPAMVRLRWKVNDTDRKPANGIDFGSQFEMHSERFGPRPAGIPGRLGEYLWWCVPEPFEMALPPGDWEITIRRGMEFVPLVDTFHIPSEGFVKRTYKLNRWIDMRKHGWYSGDDHVHCRIISDEDARRLMAWVRAEDVHVVNVLKAGNIYRTFFPQRGFGEAYRIINGDYVIVPGQECPRTGGLYALGHTISLNTQSMVRDSNKYFLYDWVADTVRAQGGLFGYAHVDSNRFQVSRDMSINVPKQKADFIEILQFEKLGTDLYYEFLNLGFKMTASAGTDVPWGGTIGEVRVYAYVGDKSFSADAWFEAVKQGRTFVSNGPMVDLKVDEARPGDEIVVNKNRKVRIRARALGDPDNMLPMKLEIIRHGEVIRSIESTNTQDNELMIDFEINVDNGFWLAARVEGSDGSRALTTPVYVIRKGLRFWKYDAVDKLIDARLAEMDKVEEMIKQVMQLGADGRAAMELMIKRLRLQGAALLKKIQESKLIYEELRQTARREKSLR